MPSRFEMNGWVHERTVRLRKKIANLDAKIVRLLRRIQSSPVLFRAFFEWRKKYLMRVRVVLQQKLLDEQKLCWTHAGPWVSGGPSFSICPNCGMGL